MTPGVFYDLAKACEIRILNEHFTSRDPHENTKSISNADEFFTTF